MNWSGKKILVTGISGFIGSNLARNLVERGADVSGIVRSTNLNHSDILPKCNIYVGDICDYDFVRQIISANEIEVVFHLAAYSIVRISARDPVTTYDVNVMGTVALLEACRSVGTCSKIVVASSDKAYGDHDRLPYNETFPLQPKNTYDVSKACMDMISQSYGHNYDLPIVVARCSNVYGPYDYNRSRIIPNTINRLLNGKPPMLYSDIEKMERDFIFIDDVVNAYIALYEANTAPGSVYNIGNNSPIHIRALIDLISEFVVGNVVSPDIVVRESVFKEIERQYIDSDNLQRETGWKPEYDLVKGLRKTVDWYKLNKVWY
jgi:CDP-glucose 4,6-dehydratase